MFDTFSLPSVRILEIWSCPNMGPSHIYFVSGVLLPLDIAEQLRTVTVPLLDVEEEMEISVLFKILPGFIKIFHLYNRRHLAYMHVPSVFNVPTTLAEDGLLLDTEHP